MGVSNLIAISHGVLNRSRNSISRDVQNRPSAFLLLLVENVKKEQMR
jgi:hypothetical protein